MLSYVLPALGGKWRNCLFTWPAQNRLIWEKRVNLQILELHSQCWTALICTRVMSRVRASGSLSSYQMQTEETRQVGCSHIAHWQGCTPKCNHKSSKSNNKAELRCRCRPLHNWQVWQWAKSGTYSGRNLSYKKSATTVFYFYYGKINKQK